MNQITHSNNLPSLHKVESIFTLLLLFFACLVKGDLSSSADEVREEGSKGEEVGLMASYQSHTLKTQCSKADLVTSVGLRGEILTCS